MHRHAMIKRQFIGFIATHKCHHFFTCLCILELDHLKTFEILNYHKAQSFVMALIFPELKKKMIFVIAL